MSAVTALCEHRLKPLAYRAFHTPQVAHCFCNSFGVTALALKAEDLRGPPVAAVDVDAIRPAERRLLALDLDLGLLGAGHSVRIADFMSRQAK